MTQLPQPLIRFKLSISACGNDQPIERTALSLSELQFKTCAITDCRAAAHGVALFDRDLPFLCRSKQTFNDRFRSIGDREHASIRFCLQLNTTLIEPGDRI